MPLIQNPSQIGQSVGAKAMGAVGGFLGNVFNNLKAANNQPYSPYGVRGVTPGAPPAVGVTAKSPTDNVKPPASTLPTPQVKSATSTVPKAPVIKAPATPTGSSPYDASGHVTLPSGAVLDRSGNIVTAAGGNNGSNTGGGNSTQGVTPGPTLGPTPAPVDFQGLYGQLITQLMNKSQAPNADYTNTQQQLISQSQQPSQAYIDAQNEAKRISDQQTQLSKDYAQKDANIQGTAGFLTQATGLEGILQRQYDLGQNALASQYQGATNRLGAANTQQSIQQSGLTSALGAANTQQQIQQNGLLGAAGFAQPQQVPYSNQYINPITGQPIGGGAGANGSLQDAVSRAVSMINSGTSYNDAAATLSGYGQGGLNALNQALPQGFDITQSNAKAQAGAASTLQTGTIGGELQKSAETVKQHMSTLKDAYSQLGAQFGIPLLNAGVNAIATQFGSGALQSYNIALQNVRDELAKILGGGSSTDGSRATAHALLPDNMTPQQIDAAIKTSTELMNSKISEYTKVSGSNTGGGSSGSTTGFNW